MYGLPWGMAALAGVYGFSEADEPRVAIASEWPIRLAEGVEYQKEHMERIHVEALRTRLTEVGKRPPYTDVRRGNDPPDFIAKRGDRELRLDCAVLTVPGRRQANAYFDLFRRALLEQPRERFERLAGCNVVVFFSGDGRATSTEMPHSAREAEAVSALVDALADARPVLVQGRQGNSGVPIVALEDFGSTGFGAEFQLAKMAGARPLTEFYMRLGFEVALGFTTEHSIEDAWAELHRVVSKHDRGQADELVITVGGPDRSGAMHMSETMFAQLLVAPDIVGDRGVPVRHLRRVWLHVWQSGLIRLLAPVVRDEAPEFYGPVVPPHLRPWDTMGRAH